MKWYYLFLLFLFSVSNVVFAQNAEDSTDYFVVKSADKVWKEMNFALDDSIHVLFIGNSITYFNDMPFMFRDIANNLGEKVSVTMYAPGGTGFVHHYVDPAVYSLFRGNTWDVVVLQPGSSESAGLSYPMDTTAYRGNILLDSIYQYSPCAQVYLYEIAYGVPAVTSYNLFFDRQTMYKDSVTKLADIMKVQMIPAGECVRAYYSMYQNLLLHNSYNDIHPGPYGSYMIAATCYNAIFQDSVTGCTYYSIIPPDSAIKFFSITDTVVLNRFPEWRINNYNLHAGFTYSITGNTVTFSNTSSNFTSVTWSFGDLTGSTLLNPVHSYLANGIYTITLYAADGVCSDSTLCQIEILSNGVEDESKSDVGLSVYPNPSNGNFTLELNENARIEIFNAQGSLVFSEAFEKGKHSVSFDAAESIYLLKASNDKGSVVHRIVIQK
ncbi:MAG: T9SS type A sorting domain-containing protein [Bacteroidota bacterium]